MKYDPHATHFHVSMNYLYMINFDQTLVEPDKYLGEGQGGLWGGGATTPPPIGPTSAPAINTP